MYLVKFLVHGEKIDQGSFKIRARNDGSLFQLLLSQGYYITSWKEKCNPLLFDNNFGNIYLNISNQEWAMAKFSAISNLKNRP